MASPKTRCARPHRQHLSEFTISREEEGSKGRFFLERDGHEAELTYSIMSPGLRIADHTGVPEELRGTGAGQALVEHLVATARDEGWKIVPLCPFVNAQRRKHPEWADAFNV